MRKMPTQEKMEEVGELTRFRLPRSAINHAIASYDTINPTGVLRLAKALKDAYEELDEIKAQLKKAKSDDHKAV